MWNILRWNKNPRGWCAAAHELRYTNVCLWSRMVPRINGKNSGIFGIKYYIIPEQIFYTARIYTRLRERNEERSVCNFVASASVSRDLPCYSPFYVVRRASPSYPRVKRGWRGRMWGEKGWLEGERVRASAWTTSGDDAGALSESEVEKDSESDNRGSRGRFFAYQKRKKRERDI